VRIMRTCREMGIETVAVYSDFDCDALHVRLAGQAVLIGTAPARESYLNIEKIISAARLTGADAGREMRQLHVVDASGKSAAHTGSSCIEWCGHLTREGFSVAGNMLAGQRVIEETARVYEEGESLPFAERLMSAMEAGEAAGGDKRGKQGAALLIHTTEDYPFLSLRVDDHADPLAELRRLHAVSLERFQPFMGCLPSREQPAGITDRAVIEERIAQFHAARAKG